VTPAARAALERYLIAMADDELVIGYRDTEWTGAGPALEEDLAFSSIGLDEVGHARLFYSLLHDLTGELIDYRARSAAEYRHATLLELACAPRYEPSGDHRLQRGWTFAIARQYLYDRFDALRLESLSRSAWEPLAEAVDKVRREEKYHLMHGRIWMERLTCGAAPLRVRLTGALSAAWPYALGLFEPLDGEEVLVAEGYLAMSSAAMRERWLEEMPAALSPLGWQQPDSAAGEPETATAPLGGRYGRHGPEWQEQWEEMTSVYRLDPGATW